MADGPSRPRGGRPGIPAAIREGWLGCRRVARPEPRRSVGPRGPRGGAERPDLPDRRTTRQRQPATVQEEEEEEEEEREEVEEEEEEEVLVRSGGQRRRRLSGSFGQSALAVGVRFRDS
ncbi:APC membrane recruitment protein 1-like [Ornithorhynchus anatinus]|uniref:APC membrane recruitment protein 1-like n=1 Tax=Ornithorhynchus anatinus TaxID=9258 RepID=UPI0019D483AF|nr:APC membrane recruitment protein 1-like [Ornithorhynchus anatinus]